MFSGLLMASNYIILWPVHYFVVLRKFDETYKQRFIERSAFAQWAGSPVRLILYYMIILFPYRINYKRGWEQLIFDKNDDLRKECGFFQLALAYYFIGTSIMMLEGCIVLMAHDFVLAPLFGIAQIVS